MKLSIFYAIAFVLRQDPRKGCGFQLLAFKFIFHPHSFRLCRCLFDRWVFSLVSIGFESEVLVPAASSAFSEVEVLGRSSFLVTDIHAVLEEKPRASQVSSERMERVSVHVYYDLLYKEKYKFIYPSRCWSNWFFPFLFTFSITQSIKRLHS